MLFFFKKIFKNITDNNNNKDEDEEFKKKRQNLIDTYLKNKSQRNIPKISEFYEIKPLSPFIKKQMELSKFEPE